MTAIPESSDFEGGRLHEVLLEYLEASERGGQPDSAEYLARYPEFAPELREFFETEDRLVGLVSSLQLTPNSNRASHRGHDARLRHHRRKLRDYRGDRPWRHGGGVQGTP